MTRNMIARYPLFRLLTGKQLDDWLAAGQEIDCDSGITLFEENTPGAWVHVVLEGRVRVLRQSGWREVTLGMLLPGDLFGEYALLPPGNNTATCRTSTPSRLLRLPLRPLRAAIEQMEPVWSNLKNWLRLHTLLHFEREQTFLGFMSADSALKLVNRLKFADFPAGHTIQTSGVADDNWYLIERGTVSLQDDGELLGVGDSFGECALIGSTEVPTAVAMSDVRCRVLPRPAFDPSAPIKSRVAQSYEPLTPGRPESQIWVPQLEKADCGLAALAMVAHRIGAKVSVEELRQKIAPGPDGLNLQELRMLATVIGLSCRSVRVSVDRLGQVYLPAIAHLSDGHFVVLHELGAGGVVIGDPATGIVTWNREFLAERYSGALLVFDHGVDAK